MSFRPKGEIFPLFFFLTKSTTRSLTGVYAELGEVFEMTEIGLSLCAPAKAQCRLGQRNPMPFTLSPHIDSQLETYIIQAENYHKMFNRTDKNNHRIESLKKLAPVLLLIFSIISCGGQKEIPAPQITGIRTTIDRILINPLAFDSAQVAVEGVAHDIIEAKTDEGVPIAVFKLADRAGNFIDVSMPTSWVVEEDDYVVVGGIYRRSKNEIEAQQLEVILLEKDKKEQ